MTSLYIDNIIRNYFNNVKTKNCATSLFKRRLNKLPLLSYYINNRFLDSNSWTETIWRIRNNVLNKPCCIECGKQLKFPFKTFCSCKCRSNNQLVKQKQKETCKINYGVEHPSQNNKIKEKIKDKLNYNEITIKTKETKLKKYGDPYYNNKEQIKKTCLEKYGVEFPLQNNKIKEKLQQTNLIKYGFICSLQNENVKNKSKLTKINIYNNENYVNINKAKQTCLERYGVDNVFKSNKIKQKIKETCLSKYGDENYRNTDKHKQTCLSKYGVNSFTQTKEFKEKVNWKIANDKQISSKIKNNTLNSSKPELFAYELLIKKFGCDNVIKQYKSKLYPFHCDFYIKHLDLYIECNFHWTHGGHPFDEYNKEDIIKLNKWKEKKTKFYNKAIDVWTHLDIKKRNIAKENNLNYIECWNIEDIKNI